MAVIVPPEIANILSKRLNHYQFPNSITLKLNKFFGGFSTLLKPYSSKDEEILRNCRDDLSNLLGIKFENHLSYTFHITLAYLLEPLTTQEVNKLQDLEKKEGFSEASVYHKDGEKIPFFNLGPKNDWRNLLNSKVKLKLEEAFEKEMKELGYI